jgi:hypothetical protein
VYCGLIIVINPEYADWTNSCTYWRFAKYDKLVSLIGWFVAEELEK